MKYAAIVRQQKVLTFLFLAVVAQGCSNQNFSTSPSKQPEPGAPPASVPTTATPPPSGLPSNQVVPVESNRFSICKAPLQGKLSAGQLACLGIWEYGDDFGADPNMCAQPGGNGYQHPAIGCEATTSICASGRAIATSILNYQNNGDGVRLATPAEFAQLASYLQVSETIVREKIIRIWFYTCAP